jgi:signal transduction histidine kinase
MNKLFILFGFLDATKEINTKGIGLGLHISKKICQAFGGDIFCESEWEKGTTFTFLIALDELNKSMSNPDNRTRNPNSKKYAKINLKKKSE